MLLLMACAGPEEEAGDAPDTGVPEVDPCEAGAPPALSTERWAQGGPVPGGGIHTFAGASGVLYAGSHNAGMWTSYDDGVSWQKNPVLVTHTLADLVLSPDDPSVVYRSSGGVLQRSDDAGMTWSDLALGRVEAGNVAEVWAIAVSPVDPARVYGVTNNGASFVSEDRGVSFVEAGTVPVALSAPGDDPFDDHAWRLLPDQEGRFVFADGAGVYTSDDAMETWQLRYASPHGGHSLLRDPLDAAHLLVGAPDGVVESWDAGETWEIRAIGTGLAYGAYSPDGSTLALASADTLHLSADGGASFVSTPHGLAGVGGLHVSADAVFLSWLDGGARSVDGGASWQDSSDGLVDEGMAILAPDPTCPNVVFTGSRCSGGLLRSTDWGATWSHVDHYFHYVMAIHFDPADPDHAWGVTDDSLLESDDGGATWRDAHVAHHFHGFAVDPSNPDTLLLGSVGSGEWADSSMRVYRSTDGGDTWVDSSAGLPATPASAHALAFWPGAPSVVLLGTYRGGDASHQSGEGVGLYRSADGGGTWSLVSAPVRDVAAITETPAGLAAATDDGLWLSSDEGETWAKASGPAGFLLSVDFAGEVGLALAQSGQAWISGDGGATWTAHAERLESNPTTWLAQVAIAADASVAWATVFERGVYRIGL